MQDAMKESNLYIYSCKNLYWDFIESLEEFQKLSMAMFQKEPVEICLEEFLEKNFQGMSKGSSGQIS